MDNNTPNNKKSLLDHIRSSAIITFLLALADLIYKKLDSGFYGGIATSYDSENQAAQNAAVYNAAKKLKWRERVSRPCKQAIARSIEQSMILGKLSDLLNSLLYCKQKLYGVFFVSLGLYIEVAFIIKTALFIVEIKDIDFTPAVIGLILLIMSLPLLFSNKTLAESLKESRIMSFVIFNIIGANPESFSKDIKCGDRMYIPFIVGMLLGLCSFVLPPLFIVIGLIALIMAIAVLIIPEFGVFLIVTFAPFAPTMLLAGLTLYVTFCFVIKLLCGRRSITFSLNDFMISAFMLLTLLGGIVSPNVTGSIQPALIYTVFLCGYFLCANLIRTKEWLTKCLYGVGISLFLVSVYGVLQYVFGFGASTWHDEEMFSDISGRVVSTFENPNVLAEYLIMFIPLAFAMIIVSSKREMKAAAMVTFAVSVVCLVFTWSRGAWLGFIFGMLLFLLMYSKKILAALFGCVALIPALPFVLPESITNRLLSIGDLADSSTSYRVHIWTGVTEMLKDYWFTGIGTGLPAFSQVYPKYALSGIEGAPHSHNLFLQIITEHGVIALIIFFMIILLYVQSVFTFKRFETRKTKLIVSAMMCGILAVLLQGLTDYIWYNYRVYLIFWLVIGLTAATRRCHRATRT
ncbi:MAG: O-antigen ligase family protein [Clostridia bacterium]|nr:O-antigen ligase family protein [Clostridia bacterium]